jgi:hypothetical protein
MPDIQFIKNNLTGTDIATFTPFPLSNAQPIANDIVPEYYLSHNCSAPGSGETQKCYQFPISSHVNTLANVPFTFTIQAQNDPNAGSTNPGANVIKLFILQDTGTGGTPSPSSVSPIPIGQFTLSTSWTTYNGTATFPATSGLVLGQGEDDALYLQVQMPLNLQCKINFTKPSIYLTSNGTFPNNDFETYDQVDAIINSPRTGDIRTSLNSFYFFGWLPMNDGVIALSNPSMLALNIRANADVWPLFNLIWNVASQYNAPGAGTTNSLAQMYTSAGTAVGYGPNITAPTTAYADFVANRQLSLTKMMGRVMMGTVPIEALLAGTMTYQGFKDVVTGSNNAGTLLLTHGTNLLANFQGQPVTFTNTGGALPGGITANTIYYVTPIGAFTFSISTTYANALARVFVAWTTDGTGTTTAYTDQTASVIGEYQHIQTINEIFNHTHSASGGASFVISPGVGVFAGGGTGQFSAVTGGISSPYSVQVPSNVTQPGTFYNMFIKL